MAYRSPSYNEGTLPGLEPRSLDSMPSNCKWLDATPNFHYEWGID
jgi:hypothetical protein